MINASTPFLVEAYDQGELNRILLAAEQTSEQFRNEVIATVQAFCLQHREHIFGCVMDTHRDTIGIIYGTKQMDDDLGEYAYIARAGHDTGRAQRVQRFCSSQSL
jgi:di/tripeptidase